MTQFKTIISALFLLIIAVWSTQAQSQCDLDVEDIINRVSEECAGIDANQVCYGNRNVTAIPQLNVEAFIFQEPGDLVSLSSIQSLIVDSVNAEENTWGVAQMRLLVGSDSGLQDVNMLLFGEFDIRNAIESTDQIELIVTVRQKTIYSLPDSQTDILDILESNAVLTGLARLEDSTWVRVENEATGIVGWTEAGGLQPVDESQSIGLLTIHEASTPYYGAMQAFYFENGNSNIGCNDVESDGLIIQTPEGQARVSLLINEVSIELVSTSTDEGESEGGRAFIQANPLNAQEMSVNVLGGSASVQTEAGSQEVSAGERTSIPITLNLDLGTIIPGGAPDNPVSFDTSSIGLDSLLPAVTNFGNSGNQTGNSNLSINTGNNAGNGSGGSSGSTSGGTGTNTTGGSSGNGGGGITIGGGSGNSTNTDSGTSSTGTSTGNNNTDNTSTNNPTTGFDFTQEANIIGATIAVLGAIIVLGFIIWSARQRN